MRRALQIKLSTLLMMLAAATTGLAQQQPEPRPLTQPHAQPPWIQRGSGLFPAPGGLRIYAVGVAAKEPNPRLQQAVAELSSRNELSMAVASVVSDTLLEPEPRKAEESSQSIPKVKDAIAIAIREVNAGPGRRLSTWREPRTGRFYLLRGVRLEEAFDLVSQALQTPGLRKRLQDSGIPRAEKLLDRMDARLKPPREPRDKTPRPRPKPAWVKRGSGTFAQDGASVIAGVGCADGGLPPHLLRLVANYRARTAFMVAAEEHAANLLIAFLKRHGYESDGEKRAVSEFAWSVASAPGWETFANTPIRDMWRERPDGPLCALASMPAAEMLRAALPAMTERARRQAPALFKTGRERMLAELNQFLKRHAEHPQPKPTK